MAIKQMRGYKKKCDDLAGKITRSAGACMRCGSTEWLQTSHIIGRRYSGTRTDLRNLQCLCASCHRRFTDWPREFSRWITESIGSELYEELQRKAETVSKMDWETEYIRLKELSQKALDSSLAQ